MDNKKKYNEALERARVYRDNARAVRDYAAVARYENIFPELRESEDERIRKEIINYLDFAESHNLLRAADYEKKKRWITYLEKQKEHKWSPSEGEMGVLYKLCYISNQITDEDDTELTRLYQDLKREYFNGHSFENMFPSEKQKEQKPALEQTLDAYKISDERATAKMEGRIEGRQDVINNPEEYGLQKPAEWSEDYNEDNLQTRFAFYTYKDDPSTLYLSNVFVEEASRNHGFGTRILKAAEKVAEAIGATTICLKVKQDSPANAWYRKNGYSYAAFEDDYDWLQKNLEYLNPAKQEWSEEDEKKRQKVIRLLEDANKNWLISQGSLPFGELIFWLKSLRPQPKQGIVLTEEQEKKFGHLFSYTHWKPSEEQMEELWNVISYIEKPSSNFLGVPALLESLYEQLQKLM